MKKSKLIIALMIAIICTFVSACGENNGNDNNNPVDLPEVAEEEAAYEETEPAEFENDEPEISSTEEYSNSQNEYILDTYTKDGTVNGGYSYTATLKIGPWVKASETENINRIWESIGGSDSVPDIDTFTYNNWSYGVHFGEGTSVMAFGTVSVDDTTPGEFSLADTSQSLSITVSSPELYKAFTVDSFIQFSDGGSYLHSHNNNSIVAYILDVNPKMNKRNWGPVPFVVCVNEVLSPEYPDGKPEAMDATWYFGDNEFTVRPIWVQD